MPKRYNTPHRSHVVKTRLTDEEYADFTERLAPYGSAATRCRIQTLRGIFLQRGKSDGKAIAFLTDIPRSGMTG